MKLDLLQYFNDLKITFIADKPNIFDPIRKKNLIIKPEEIVRQLVITYFIKENIYPISRIAVEKNIKIDGKTKRFDILVFDKEGKPFLLVECKSFKTNVNENVIKQISIYNHKLKAPYLFVTNGNESFLFEIDFTTNSYKESTVWP
jgi:hypothetical protein